MNTKHHIALLCCIGFPFFGQAQTAQVCIAKTNYPAEFLDANLSVTNRQRIASDLSLVFSLAPSFEELRRGGEIEDGAFKPNDDVAMFSFSEWSKDFLLVDKNNTKNIRITKAGSDRYLRSFALIETHSNAVQKAHAFVTMLNHTNLLTWTIQDLRGLFHANLVSEDLSDDDIREIITEMQKYNFFDISALNFFLQRVSQIDNAEVLVMGLYMKDKINPSQEKYRGWSFDFYEGKWGFGRTPLDLDESEIVK